MKNQFECQSVYDGNTKSVIDCTCGKCAEAITPKTIEGEKCIQNKADGVICDCDKCLACDGECNHDWCKGKRPTPAEPKEDGQAYNSSVLAPLPILSPEKEKEVCNHPYVIEATQSCRDCGFTPPQKDDWEDIFSELDNDKEWQDFCDRYAPGGMFDIHDDNLQSWIAQWAARKKSQWQAEARREERERITKGIEDYKIPKEIKANELGADYIFVYDLKTFVLKSEQ